MENLVFWILMGLLSGAVMGVIAGLLIQDKESARSTIIGQFIGYIIGGTLVLFGCLVATSFVEMPILLAFTAGFMRFYMFVMIYWAIESIVLWIMVS